MNYKGDTLNMHRIFRIHAKQIVRSKTLYNKEDIKKNLCKI